MPRGRSRKVALTPQQKAAQTRAANREIKRLEEEKLARKNARDMLKQYRHAFMYNSGPDSLLNEARYEAVKNMQQDPNLIYKDLIAKGSTIQVDFDTASRLRDVAQERDISVSELLRVLCKTLSVSVCHYKLNTVVDFGKYIGEKMENVIKVDPSYASWMTKKIDRLTFDQDVLDLLSNVLGVQDD